MHRFLRAGLLLIALAGLGVAADAHPVYDAVAASLAGQRHRLPGSPAYAAALDAVEGALRGAGLDPHRLRYTTLVPQTRTCRLTVDGREIPGVLAMAPNGVVPPTSWGRDLSGPAVWLGGGSLAEMDGLPVRGSIAFVRLGCQNLPEIFSQGAQAVVAVGGDATQWQTARMFTEAPIASPRAWMPQDLAEAGGLTTNRPGPRQASLRLDVAWADAEAADLWALIPGTAGPPSSQAGQVVVLAAELATGGAVPELSPGGRQAANAALLAELAARLHRQRPGRSVLVVFLGSHYAAQDGARVLYWVVNKASRGSRDDDRLADRSGWTEAQQAVCEARLRLLADDGVLASRDPEADWLRNQMRRLVNAEVNDLNFTSRGLNLARRASAGDEAAATAIAGKLAENAHRVDVQNGLRRQLHERRVSDPESFAGLRGRLAGEVAALRDWLAADRQRLGSARELESALQGRRVIAHFGIDFADPARAWFANPFGQDCEAVGGLHPGHFSKHLDAYQQAWERVAARLPGAPPFRGPDLAASYGYDNLCTPGRRQVPCVVALGQGLMGSQLVTLGDPLDRDELPVVWNPDLSPLAGPVGTWLREILASELPLKTGLQPANLYDGKLVWRWKGGDWKGLRIDRLARGSEEVDGPAAGALVFVRGALFPGPGAVPACGRSNIPAARVNPAGYAFAPTVADNWTRGKVDAMAFDASGAPQAYFDGATSTDAMTFNIRLFTGYGNAVYTPFTPMDYGVPGLLQRLSGRSDSEAKRRFGMMGNAGSVVVTSEDRALKLLGSGLFILGSRDGRPNGYGIAPDPAGLLNLDTVRTSAADASALNQSRLEILRSKDLVNRPVERVHADCRDNLEAAAEARQAGSTSRAAAHETVAAALAYRAHGPLRDGANDLLRAVVVLLVLSIPFAFALERLVIGAVSIYRQILGFLGIFVATFAVLYATHPAFAMADSPLIIFLAFVIILLSGFVISVVMGKFKHELKALQGLSARSHSTGNANSTTLAAVIIGIAGMRNRPLKTFLTIVTVVLLTFTILVFASFQSGDAVVQTYLGRGRGADRIEVHQPSFVRIPDRLVDAVETLHRDRFEVVRRTACFREPTASDAERSQANVLLEPASGRALRLDALLGIDQREAALLPGLGAIIGKAPEAADAPPIWLAEAVAARWHLQPGAELRMRGKRFVLAGTFPEERLRSLENIDGTRLTPPDFEATFAAAGQYLRTTSFAQTVQAIDTTTFVFASPALTAITVNPAVRDLGGGVTTLTLYPRAGADVGRAAGEIAEAFNGPVFSTTGDGARRWFYTREVTGGGYLDLMVPMLLGGLIIFSSLLGSIVDRQKEIFTYSALGLSPRDVGTLFFAESAVIAVVGGMGGYLLGQLAAKVLNILAGRGLLAVPDLNFSSLSSLVTILVVMAMVMLSTIYPALMAGRSANPGVNRAWKMPRPDGDRLVFTFPFTVPEASFGGIVAFIREHFSNHGDAALDVFAAKRFALYQVGPGRVGIRAEVALAPFDLGVYQRFAMHTRPSDIPGIDEVVVEIDRVNGAPATWLRGNRAFVADLREQFLLWRSLPAEVVAHYQAAAVRLLAEPQEAADVQG